MFKTLILFLGLFGCCLAQLCCVPNTWEGIQRQTAGSIQDEQPTIEMRNVKVSYDLTNFRAASEENTTVNGNIVKVKVIQMYKDGIEYIISGDTCSKKMIPSSPKFQCVPDTATLVGTHLIVDGNKNVSVNNYKYEVNGVSSSIMMTEQGCKPVSEVSYGSSNGVQFLSSVLYYDMIDGIVDPTVFNIPPICSNAQLISAVETDQIIKGIIV